MFELLSIIYLIITTYGLGSFLLRFLIESDEPMEKHILRSGVGFSVFIVLGVLLHLLGIKMSWWIFLLPALPSPVYDIWRWYQLRSSRPPRAGIKKTTLLAMGAVIISLLSLWMYTQGAFSYPYLEDGDPWHHAVSTRYVADEKVLYNDFHKWFRYLDAYPPGYALITAMTYQITGEMVWTLKFFNAGFISFGILLFYFFARHLFNDSKTALIATAILAMIPSYFSHFIWSHTLAVMLFFPVFYAALKMAHHPKWIIPGAVGIGAMFMTQPSTPVKGLVLLVCLGIAHTFHDLKMWKRYSLLIVGGILLSGLWWAPMALKYDSILEGGLGQRPTTNVRWSSESHFGPLGSGTRLYTAKDFFTSTTQTLITAPVGIGLVPMVLAILGGILVLMLGKSLIKEKWPYLAILLWAVFTFAGLFGGTKLPLALFTFRFWLIFPLAVALFAAIAVEWIGRRASSMSVPQPVFLVVVLVLVAWSSGTVKWELNTMQWGPDPGMNQYNQQDSYEYIRNLPKHSRIFDVCTREKYGDTILLAYDMDTCFWCAPERELRGRLINQSGWALSPEDLRAWLRQNKYQYFFIEGQCIDTLQRELSSMYNITDDSVSRESTAKFISDVASSGLFKPVHQTQGSVLFEVP